MDEEMLCAAATADGGVNNNHGRADGCGKGSISQADGNTINNREETREGIAVRLHTKEDVH